MSLLQRINAGAAALVVRGITPTRLEVTAKDWGVLFDELSPTAIRDGLAFAPLEAMGYVSLSVAHCGPVHVAPAREGFTALCWPDRPPGVLRKRFVVHGWHRARIIPA